MSGLNRFFYESFDSYAAASLETCVREYYLHAEQAMVIYADNSTNKCWFGNPSTSSGYMSPSGSSWTVHIKQSIRNISLIVLCLIIFFCSVRDIYDQWHILKCSNPPFRFGDKLLEHVCLSSVWRISCQPEYMLCYLCNWLPQQKWRKLSIYAVWIKHLLPWDPQEWNKYPCYFKQCRYQSEDMQV